MLNIDKIGVAVHLVLLSSAAPCLAAAAPRLLPAYARLGRYDEVLLAVRELSARDPAQAQDLYPLAVSSLGAAGELSLMEDALKEMSRAGRRVNSATGNAFVRHYAAAGTVWEMEAAVGRLRKTSLLISADAIRAVASAYVTQRQYYRLGEFARGLGLGRRNAGNLLWNLYLLSFVANFKMKSLQRAFLEMADAGFRPDITTFNIRAAAFSKMCMFWDLHLTADHMRSDGVKLDLVTHGCFMDAYMERRLACNLSFAFRRLDGAGPATGARGAVKVELLAPAHAPSAGSRAPPRPAAHRAPACCALCRLPHGFSARSVDAEKQSVNSCTGHRVPGGTREALFSERSTELVLLVVQLTQCCTSPFFYTRLQHAIPYMTRGRLPSFVKLRSFILLEEQHRTRRLAGALLPVGGSQYGTHGGGSPYGANGGSSHYGVHGGGSSSGSYPP
ncbi:pentatricopeptide repeat-containing protein At3g42630-like [Lolium perenne]|uniref:pentatricopeptide repeat-containing protein At3g42630-like n=1 Tax=Lolium perenne TaxID=4522 RepID=UPI0021F554F5|nr:pentatricopeptide repeat-containing protein At3g42630-like [Lolium perenne]